MWIYFLITGKLAQLGRWLCGELIYGTSKVTENKLGQLPNIQLNFKLNLYSNRPQTADGCWWCCWWCCWCCCSTTQLGNDKQINRNCRHCRLPLDVAPSHSLRLTISKLSAPSAQPDHPHPRWLGLKLELLVNYFSRPTQHFCSLPRHIIFHTQPWAKKKNTRTALSRNRFKWIYLLFSD